MNVEGKDMFQKFKVFCRIRVRQRHGRQVQTATDGFRDLARGQSRLVYRMITSARRSMLKRQPEQPRGIKAMDGWPAILSVTDPCGGTLVPAPV